MAVSQGMNHSAVLVVAGQLDTDQQTVTDLAQRAETAVSAVVQNWFGSDSTQFAADWAAHSRQLQMAADAIASMSRQARTQASDQQATSAA
ncbi:MAG TPA: hypothetical protein VN712_00550 [Dermatophilaceae bacterium]|nr:hypothetical protein [Dermatophilaceae bacterium]